METPARLAISLIVLKVPPGHDRTGSINYNKRQAHSQHEIPNECDAILASLICPVNRRKTSYRPHYFVADLTCLSGMLSASCGSGFPPARSFSPSYALDRAATHAPPSLRRDCRTPLRPAGGAPTLWRLGRSVRHRVVAKMPNRSPQVRHLLVEFRLRRSEAAACSSSSSYTISPSPCRRCAAPPTPPTAFR